MKKAISLAIALALLVTANSYAATIIFTYTSTGSGNVGSTSFTNAPFTITQTADTASRVSFPGGFSIDAISASIAIGGAGNFSFTSGTRTFVNIFGPEVGFSRAGANGLDLIVGPKNAAFYTWDMLTSIGPIIGLANFLQWQHPPDSVTTDGGTLLFSSVNSTPSTFTATIAPEPSAAVLACFGFGLLALRRNRQTRA